MNGQAQDYQVFKRPMTDAERKSVNAVYKNAQKQARPAGFFALVFALIGIFSGAASDITSVLVLVVGLLAFVLSIVTFRLRRNVADVQKEGNVIVVRAAVSRFNGKMNTSAMMVGPLAIGWNKRSATPLQEGSFAEVACVPKLRSAVSINGAGMDHPIKLVIPADLEAMAAIGAPAYPAPPVNAPNQIPAPISNGMCFCPSCGTPAKGMAFCTNCGNRF
jgi:hypothetical protein